MIFVVLGTLSTVLLARLQSPVELRSSREREARTSINPSGVMAIKGTECSGEQQVAFFLDQERISWV